MCINFNYYLLFILHAFTCTVVYFILFTLHWKKKKEKKKKKKKKSSSAYASTKPRSIAHAKQLGHRGKEATIDRARKSARPFAAMNPRCRGWRS